MYVSYGDLPPSSILHACPHKTISVYTFAFVPLFSLGAWWTESYKAANKSRATLSAFGMTNPLTFSVSRMEGIMEVTRQNERKNIIAATKIPLFFLRAKAGLGE